jgi:hypothetical protein
MKNSGYACFGAASVRKTRNRAMVGKKRHPMKPAIITDKIICVSHVPFFVKWPHQYNFVSPDALKCELIFVNILHVLSMHYSLQTR